MQLLDQQSQEAVSTLTSGIAKATPVALGGQFIFGYTINEVAALVGIIVTLVQFSYWVWEKFFKEEVPYGSEI